MTGFLHRRPALTLAVAAAILMLPSLIWGTLPSHSSLHNLTWAPQFSDQFRHGILYPRWLPESFKGLGAPTFYFYPPLAFWADAVVRLITFDVLSTSYRLSLSYAILLWLSGLAMHAWLRSEKISERIALWGALAYMAAPYHQVEHYIRGAIAEFSAYCALPLVIWGVALVADRRRSGPVVLAFAYAALVWSHLPTALLISITAIPAYVLFLVIRKGAGDRWFLVRCGSALVLGLGIAAIYLAPALTLQAAASIDWLWMHGFRVQDSYLLMPGQWIQPPDMYLLIISIATGWLMATLGLLLAWRMAPPDGRARPSILLWAFVSLACLVLMSGLVPWFWMWVPMVSKVGFAWRLLIVVEFALVSALCLQRWPIGRRPPVLLMWLAVVGVTPGLVVLLNGTIGRVELALKGDVPAPQDAREYLPAHYPLPAHYGYADLGLEPVDKVPLIACAPEPRLCHASERDFGALDIDIDGDAATTVVLRRFFFPAWRLEPDLPLGATDPLRLLTFTAPAGHTSLRLRRVTLPEEKAGWAVSGLSLVLLLGWLAMVRRTR